MFAILLTPALAAAPTPGTAATLSYGQGVGQVVVVTAPGEHVSAEAPATLSSPRGTVTGNGALDWARVAVEPGDLVSLTVGVCRDGGTECRVDSLVGESSGAQVEDGWNAAEREVMQATIAARQPFLDFAFSRDNADGSRQTFRVSGEPMFNQSSRFIGYRGIGVETTAGK